MADVVIVTIGGDLTDAETRRDDAVDGLRGRGYEASWQCGERGVYEVTGVRPGAGEVEPMAWDGEREVS